MRNNKGFTLVEVIVAIALLGIISIGFLTLFSVNYSMMDRTKASTVDLFNAQEEVEVYINEVREEIANDIWSEAPKTIELFGREVKGSMLNIAFPSRPTTEIKVFLSEIFSKKAVVYPPASYNVKINISNDPNDLTANINSTLQGTYLTIDGSAEVFTHIFKWYVSDAAAVAPVFPRDYKQIANQASSSFSNLSPHINKYIIFTVTPVDIFGLRGVEASSQRIFVNGPDWKTGTFPWVDLNDNGIFDEGIDFRLDKDNLLMGFDTTNKYYDDDLNEVSLMGGALYVPTNIGDIILENTNMLDWKVCKSINLATNIEVKNSTNISLITREGNITFYQFKNSHGNNTAPKVTTDKGLLIKTEGRGNITLQNNSLVEVKEGLSLYANGQISIIDGTLKAAGDIIIDTTGGSSIHNNREIGIFNSVLLPNGPLVMGTIDIKSRHKIKANSSEILSNGNKKITLTSIDSLSFGNSIIGGREGIDFKGSIELTSRDDSIIGDGGVIISNGNATLAITANKEVSLVGGKAIISDGEVKITFARGLNLKSSEVIMNVEDYIEIFTSDFGTNYIYSEEAVFNSKDNTAKVRGFYQLTGPGPQEGIFE